MQLYKKILCPVDFSEFSALALRYASALAKENDALLFVYHSLPDLSQALGYLDPAAILTARDALQSNTESRLREFIESIVPQGVQVLQQTGTESPSNAIPRIALEQEFDLIVMGTHGHTGYERFFVGSTTNKVLHKSTVPVLTVCKPSHNFVEKDSNGSVHISRIVCALDLEPNNIGIAERALAIARSYQSTIFFLHVAPEKEGLVDLDQEEKSVEIMKELVGNAPEDWCTVRYLLRTGDPAREIMNALADSNADLLVMGHHTRKPIEEVFLGSVAKKLVTDSPCPVLVVRTVHDAVIHDVVLI